MSLDLPKYSGHLFTIALVGALAFFALWTVTRPNPVPVNVAVPAKAAPEVAKLPTVNTPVAFKTVKTYPKAVKRKLGLPEPVQVDDAKQVIAASQLPADDHTQTVTTLINVQTGEAETYYRRDPRPLFALDFTGDAGMYFGFTNGVQAIRLEARQGVFAIKEIHVGGIVSLDQPISSMRISPSTFIGGGAWGHW